MNGAEWGLLLPPMTEGSQADLILGLIPASWGDPDGENRYNQHFPGQAVPLARRT